MGEPEMTIAATRKTNLKLRLSLLLCSLFLILISAGAAWAVLNDVAIYRPNVDGAMTCAEQEACSFYINYNISPASKVEFAGCGQEAVDSLVAWMNSRMQDGKSDLLLIIDMCPAAVFQGEADGSLAEQWMESGNMLVWTGSEPFGKYVDVSGMILEDGAGAEGANKVLDVSTSGLCRGGGLQEGTTAVRDYLPDYGPDHPEAPKPAIIEYTDGDYHISEYRAYNACNALKYDQLLIDALSSDWNHMSYWRPEEVFAENGESYQADNIVLVNTDGGEFGQFYCGVSETPGFDVNEARKMVIAQVLNNWANLPCNTIVVAQDGSGQFTTIQAGIDAAQRRDTVLVKEGVYNEQLVVPVSKRGIKLVSDASNGGNELCDYPVDGVIRKSSAAEYPEFPYGSKRILRRTFRTVIDGTGLVQNKPMIDFPKGATTGSIIDGFTVEKMPQTNHQLSGHAHVVQTRGGCATIINNLVRNNGSSGLGSHAQVWGEYTGVSHRTLDFRYTNVKYDAHPILINNVVHNNEGNNLGNNHYSYALMYNNECFESISFEGHESPAIGCQHGAHPLIVKNLVYKSAWVGIGSRKGEQAGAYPVNRPSHAVMRGNWVFDSGQGDSSGTHDSETWEKDFAPNPPEGIVYPYPGAHGAGIGADDTGGYDPKTGEIVYQIIEGNFVKGAQNAAIGCRSSNPAYHDLPAGSEGEYPPDLGYVKITNNTVIGGGMVDGVGDPEKNGAGIGIDGAHAAEIRDNTCYDNDDAGIGIRGGGCELIEANEAYQNGRAGIGLCQGTAVTGITNNHLHHNGMAGIGHDGAEGRVSVDIESGNTIHNNGMAGIGNMSSDVGVIAANEAYENAEAGIGMQMGATVDEITDNYLHHNLAAGIGHDGSQGRVSVSVESGNILANNGAAGIGNISSDIGLIAENESYQNGAAGIGLTAGATVGEIIDNDLHNNGAAGIGHSGDVVVTLESGNMISENSAAGLAIEGGSRVTEIRGCFVDYNRMPGITVVGGSVAGMIDDCTLDHNGTSCTTGMSVLGGSSAAVRNSTISYSGRTNISVLDAGTSASLENCTLDHASQCGSGPNITVQGADAILTGCNLAYTVGSPNIETSGSGTVLTMYGCNVTKSAKPGIVAGGGAVLNIQNSVFDNNGTDGTVGMSLSGCDITFKGMTICNSPHWGISMDGCVGSIKECNIYGNASWGGGQLTIGSSNLDIVRNVLHDPAGLHNEIALLSGSDCRVYHNTIVGRSDGGGGSINRGPGDGVYVDGWSRADIRNNIFYRLPRGITPGVATTATVDNPAAQVAGDWYSDITLTGFAGTDYLVGPMGDGSQTCTWSFTISAAGNYNVYAWWPAAYATNAPYTIYYHEGSETVRVNQTAGGGLWNLLGTYHFEPGTYSVVLANDADADVVADAIQLGRTADIAASTNCFYVMSAITYKGIIGDNIIESNPYLDANYYLDSYSPCVDAAEPIAGVNAVYSGNGPDVGAKEGEGIRGELLWKTPATLISTNNSNGWRLIDDNLTTGNNSGGNYFTYEIASPDGKPVPVYGMRFYAGTYASNWHAYVADSPDGPWQVITRVFAMEGGFGWLVGDEGPIWEEYSADFLRSGKYILLVKQYGQVGANSVYEFDIQTNPEAQADDPDTFVVDNDVAAFAGTWTANSATLGFYGSDYRYYAAGAGEATATWTPEIVTPGDCDVYARWTAYTNRATNAPYTINYDGGSETITVNQQAQGGRWVYLGTYPFAAGISGNVALSNNADGYVIADAILFIRK